MATATYLPMKKSGGHKIHRSPAQKAATKRMIAGLKASRRSNTVTLGGLDRVPLGSWARSSGRVVKGGKFVHTGTKTTAYKKKAKGSKPKAAKRTTSKATRSPAQKAATKRMLAGLAASRAGGKLVKSSKGKGGKKSKSKTKTVVRSNGPQFVSSKGGKIKYRTNTVLVHRTKHARNPVGFDDRDGLTRLGTWGKVGVGILFGLAGLLVAFGVPKGIAVLTGKDLFQRGWGGVGTAAVATVGVSIGTGLLVGLLSKPMGKKVTLGLLAAGGLGVALLAGGAIFGKNFQLVIPVNEAVLASMLSMSDAPAGSRTTQAPLYNVPGVGITTMAAEQAAAMGLQSVGMGQITYYPAAPGMGVYPQMPLAQVTHYPAGAAGYNAPAPGAVGTPNAQVYERAAGQTSGPQGYNAPQPGAVSTADPNVRYSATTKEKF